MFHSLIILTDIDIYQQTQYIRLITCPSDILPEVITALDKLWLANDFSLGIYDSSSAWGLGLSVNPLFIHGPPGYRTLLDQFLTLTGWTLTWDRYNGFIIIPTEQARVKMHTSNLTGHYDNIIIRTWTNSNKHKTINDNL